MGGRILVEWELRSRIAWWRSVVRSSNWSRPVAVRVLDWSLVRFDSINCYSRVFIYVLQRNVGSSFSLVADDLGCRRKISFIHSGCPTGFQRLWKPH